MTDEPGDLAPRVRPYVLTGGRTEPVAPDVRLETMVVASGNGPAVDSPASAEARTILSLCREARSLAELAARANLPLGVARVLVADLANAGHVEITAGATEASRDITLLKKVLDGIREL